MQLLSTSVPAIKGAIPECLDVVSQRADARELMTRLQAEIEALRDRDFKYLENVFAEHLLSHVYTEKEPLDGITTYLGTHWFDEFSESAYFPELQPIASVYAEGVLTTLALSLRAKGKPTPIDAWWLIGYSTLEMINLVSKQQITLLIATPRPAHIAKSPTKHMETEVWTTKRSKVESRQFLRKPKSS